MSDHADLVAGALAGQPRSLARLMSLAEGPFEVAAEAMAEVHRHTGRAHVVGITGVPGSGKSTLVAALARAARKAGRTVGVVAVDPSSPYSGGAILGDRVRMTDLATDDGVFIRSVATGGALGGLARPCMDMVDILDAAGFDLVMVETVGVGQDEVDIARAAHTVCVVSAPGLGDGIQAIKAGVLEIADIHVVSKADKPDAPRTAADLKGMLKLGLTGRDRRGWDVPVVMTSAETGDGVEELLATLEAHRQHLKDSGELAVRRREILQARVAKAAQDMLAARITASADLAALLDAVEAGEIAPRQAARRLLGEGG